MHWLRLNKFLLFELLPSAHILAHTEFIHTICDWQADRKIENKQTAESNITHTEYWDRISKRPRSPGIDVEESISPAYVACRIVVRRPPGWESIPGHCAYHHQFTMGFRHCSLPLLTVYVIYGTHRQCCGSRSALFREAGSCSASRTSSGSTTPPIVKKG